MDANTEVKNGQTTDNDAFKSYSNSQSVKPSDMKGGPDHTPRPVGKTSAPHQLGNGSGVSTNELY